MAAELAARIHDLAEKYFEMALELGVDEAESLLHAQVSPEIEQKLRADLEARINSNDDYVETSLLPDIEDGLDGDGLVARAAMYAGQLYPTANAGLVTATSGSGLVWEWKLDPGADHCSDCIEIAAGGPYSDPDDDVSDLPELPTFPGDGDSQCLSLCRCEVVIEQGSWNKFTAANDAGDEA